MSLPPPKKAATGGRAAPQPASGGGGAQPPGIRPATPPDMSSYYAGSGGGCFAPTSTVQRLPASGEGEEETVRIGELRKGDLVRTANGTQSTVECLVQIARAPAKSMVRLPRSGLTITGKHPVCLGDGEWVLPKDVEGAELLSCAELGLTAVFNVVLSGAAADAKVLVVNGVDCITWRHDLQAPPLLRHAFFGTSRVVDSLKAIDALGYARGFVQVDGCVRDSASADGVTVLGLTARKAVEVPAEA